MRSRTLDGLILDSLGFWTFVALLTLFAFLIWGVLEVQDHYYFPTVPYTYQAVAAPTPPFTYQGARITPVVTARPPT